MVVSLAGCSSSDGGAGGGSGTPIPSADQGLAGEYVAEDASGSPFRSITFVDDTRYLLQPTSCPDSDDCRQQGWYTVAGDEVTLHDDVGDPEQVFSVAVLSSGPVPTATDGADDDSDAGVTITMTEDEGTTTTQSETVARGADAIVSSGSQIVGTNQVFAMSVGGSRYDLVNSSGQVVTASNARSLVKASTGPLVGSSILFEGSCNFLHSCSSFSKKLPAGEVSWGCVGVKACSDTDHWMAGPSRAYCNKTVNICHGSTCTTGQVLDVSNAGAWEGSEGLLTALGLPYSLTGACSGTGGGMVTIRD
jgi:hypothetical protein